MPIRIEYGAQVSPGLPAMAQTAMRIRAEAAAAALRAQRGSGGGGGGRGGQTNLAQQKYDLAAQQAYYDKQSSSQDSNEAIRQAEYEQGLKERGFDYEYTETARQELAQINNSRQRVKSSKDFSPEEQATMLRELDQKEYGIEKSAVPAAKEKHPEGQRNGDIWTDEDGNLMRRGEDGRPDVLLEHSKTREGIQTQWDYDQKVERSKWARELLVTEVDKLVGGKMVKERISAPEVAKIYRAEREAQIEMDRVDQELQEEQARLAQEQEQLAEEKERMASPDFWIERAQLAGLQLTKEDVELGPENGPKRAILRELHKKRRLTSREEQEMKQLTKDLLYAAGEIEAADAIVIRELPSSAKKKGLKKQQDILKQGISGGSYGIF